MNRQSITDQLLPQSSAAASKTVFSQAPWCVVWLLMEAGGVALAAAYLGSTTTTAGVGLMFYAFQGLVAEVLGVKVDADSISAPRRLWAAMPFLVLWRERIPLYALREVVSLPKFAGFERVRARWGSSGRVAIFFPDREHRLAFFRAVTTAHPSTSIYRSS